MRSCLLMSPISASVAFIICIISQAAIFSIKICTCVAMFEKRKPNLTKKRHILLIFCSFFVYFITARLLRYALLLCLYAAFEFFKNPFARNEKPRRMRGFCVSFCINAVSIRRYPLGFHYIVSRLLIAWATGMVCPTSTALCEFAKSCVAFSVVTTVPLLSTTVPTAA